MRWLPRSTAVSGGVASGVRVRLVARLLGGALAASSLLALDGAPGTAPAEGPSVVDLGAPPQSFQEFNAPYDGLFHFVRVRYDPRTGGRGFFGRGRRGREPYWAHDYPRAEHNFLAILTETTFVRSRTDDFNVIRFDDPELFKYPVAYIVEVGQWDPTDAEVAALGEYLRKGGFLIVDDTRNDRGFEFQNFESHMARALPGLSLVQIGMDHEIFDSFFRIDPEKVIPLYGPQNDEYWAIFEDNDPSKRIMVLLNFNNDIAEYWEFSDRGYYPIDLSNEAYKLGVNYVVYGLTH